MEEKDKKSDKMKELQDINLKAFKEAKKMSKILKKQIHDDAHNVIVDNK